METNNLALLLFSHIPFSQYFREIPMPLQLAKSQLVRNISLMHSGSVRYKFRAPSLTRYVLFKLLASQ